MLWFKVVEKCQIEVVPVVVPWKLWRVWGLGSIVRGAPKIVYCLNESF